MTEITQDQFVNLLFLSDKVQFECDDFTKTAVRTEIRHSLRTIVFSDDSYLHLHNDDIYFQDEEEGTIKMYSDCVGELTYYI